MNNFFSSCLSVAIQRMDMYSNNALPLAQQAVPHITFAEFEHEHIQQHEYALMAMGFHYTMERMVGLCLADYEYISQEWEIRAEYLPIKWDLGILIYLCGWHKVDISSAIEQESLDSYSLIHAAVVGYYADEAYQSMRKIKDFSTALEDAFCDGALGNLSSEGQLGFMSIINGRLE